jgi:hypothetical protein
MEELGWLNFERRIGRVNFEASICSLSFRFTTVGLNFQGTIFLSSLNGLSGRSFESNIFGAEFSMFYHASLLSGLFLR